MGCQLTRLEVLSLATKDYSIKQEKLIAEYLGWKCVVASGARACHPGDIKNDTWLGECKTHVTTGNRIKFIYKEWAKICEEAMSKFRFPVLFVDDGSQKEVATWCMVNAKVIAVDDQPTIEQVVAKSSLFVSEAMMAECDQSLDKMLKFNFNGDTVLVMRLATFKDLCCNRY